MDSTEKQWFARRLRSSEYLIDVPIHGPFHWDPDDPEIEFRVARINFRTGEVALGPGLLSFDDVCRLHNAIKFYSEVP